MLYRLKYAYWLWRIVPGIGVIGALRYPCDRTVADGDPKDEAREEYYAMREASR